MFVDGILEAQHQEQHLCRRVNVPFIRACCFPAKAVRILAHRHSFGGKCCDIELDCAVVFVHDGTGFMKGE